MARHSPLVLVLALVLLPAAPAVGGEAPVAAGSDCAESVARRVQAHYEGVNDLRARFTQTTQSVALGESLGGAQDPAHGVVVFAKPGKMHWSYEAPEPSVVVSDGSTLWIHDPVAREVQVLQVEEGFLSGAAIQFLLGEGQILEAFRVTARGCGQASVQLVLDPREPATYERLELSVDPKSGALLETTVLDLFGNRTHVVFGKVEINLGPADAFFRFEPPEGTRVLRIPGAP